MSTDVSCCAAYNRSVKSFRSARSQLNISSPTRLHKMCQCVQRERPFLGWLPFVFSWSRSSFGYPSPITHSRALTCGKGASQTRVEGQLDVIWHSIGPAAIAFFYGLACNKTSRQKRVTAFLQMLTETVRRPWSQLLAHACCAQNIIRERMSASVRGRH